MLFFLMTQRQGKAKDSRCQNILQKTWANDYHEIYMYSEHSTNTDDSFSLSNIFYVGNTLYLVWIAYHHITATQAFKGQVQWQQY